MRTLLLLLAAATALAYPPAPRGDVVDTYFGTPVPDPYRWLESIDSPQTVAWVRAENALTRSYLDAIRERPAIREAYRRLVDYERESVPFRAGPRWFFTRNSGLQNQAVLYVRYGERGAAHVFLDPNRLSKDGTVALAGTSFTRDGKYLAYATQSSGSDWETWHVKEVASGRDLPDTIAWSKFSDATWVGDGGFYYAGYDPPKHGELGALGVQKLWFHRLGTAQPADRLVYASSAHPDEFVGAATTEDERYVFFITSKGNGNSLAWKRRTEPDSAFRPLFALDPDVGYDVVGDDGARLYLRTNLKAPRRRLVWLDLRDPRHRLHDLVPEGRDALENATLIGDRFYLQYLHDARTRIAIADLHGRALGTVALPGIGSAGAPSGRRRDRFAYYSFTSYTYPTTIYRYDTRSGASTVAFRPHLAFDPSPFVTEQIFTRSKDGTRIPLFVVHRRGLALDGTAPAILYGYGGFGISLTPRFSSAIALWLQMGGLYAVATLRGGGEYGEAWHDAGRLANKQHVFDDFIAAAHALIDRKFTSTPKLAISGGSNGGLLVGAVLVQHPELFGAALPEVGVLDMLRYQTFTVGKAWIPEYGSATASAQQFRTLLAYSPYHNAKPAVYPPTLIATADHDDRVFPAHSFKFAAALQYAQQGPAPILLRVESDSGHGGGRPTDKIIEEVADQYAFLLRSLAFTPKGLPSP